MTVEAMVKKDNVTPTAPVETKHEIVTDPNNREKALRAEETIKIQTLAQRMQKLGCVASLCVFYLNGDYQQLLLVSPVMICLFERGFLSLQRSIFFMKGDNVMVDAMDARVPQNYSFLTNIGNKLIVNPVKAAVTSIFCGCSKRSNA